MNDKRIIFRNEFVPLDSVLKEMIRGLNRSEDKQSIIGLIEKISQGDIVMSSQFQNFTIRVIDYMMEYNAERIKAYQEKYQLRLICSFRPQRIEQKIAALALEDTQKMIEGISAVGNPLFQGITETRVNAMKELCQVLVRLLGPETLDNHKLLTIQKELGTRNE